MQALGGDRERRGYWQTALACYQPFWTRGLGVDVIAAEDPFHAYRLIVAPMLYLLKPGVAARLRRFVEQGGTLVTTYWSGLVDENDLCFLGGWPGDGLREVLGIWDEETDTLRRMNAMPCCRSKATNWVSAAAMPSKITAR